MAFNRFYLQIVTRVILFSLSCFALIWFYTQTERLFTIAFFFIITIVQITLTIRYLNRTNRDLATFLIYLKEKDPNLSFSADKIKRTFHDLDHRFDEVNREMRRIRLENEYKSQFLDLIVKNVEAGIITFDEQGKIGFFNRRAQSILGVPKLQTIGDLDKKHEGLGNLTLNLRPGFTKTKTIQTGQELMHLSIKTTVLKYDQHTITLVTFQNIKNELDEKELESWQKIIRVLTHEIMNSITPITTVTTSIQRLFRSNGKQKPLAEITTEHIEDTLSSTDIIAERGKGLINFLENYRKLSRLPQPKLQNTNIGEVFNKIEVLMKEEFRKRNIILEMHLPNNDISLEIDKDMILQVLINLLKNAMESLENNPSPKIKLELFENTEGVSLSVTDNGPGISTEDMDQIFVPFFTTKEGGTGIGLSLSRQIMRLHGGTLNVVSTLGMETRFILGFTPQLLKETSNS